MTYHEVSTRRAPRVDPLGLLPVLQAMSSAELGEFAYPFTRACIDGRADNTTRHILDLIGWVLRSREEDA